MSSQGLGQTLPGPSRSDDHDDFELNCDWRHQNGHPHLAIGYVVIGEETVWGVYVCSATNVTCGNEWAFTLPMTLNIVEVNTIALNVIAWDRFVVIESERPFYDETVKHHIMESLRSIEQLSRPCKLVNAIREFFGK